jgi:hypothetical protein
MILFWLSYDVMRLYSDSLIERAAVEAPLRWERALFPAPDGEIWPFLFTRMLEAPHGWELALLESFCSLVYVSQLFAMPLVMFLLWTRRSPLFARLLWALTALHAATLAIYFAFPAAPPWWVYENGLAQPTPERSFPAGFAQSPVLSRMFHMSPNRFAAVPSMHGAYPLLLALVLARARAGIRAVAAAAAYAAAMWFACVFLNQHYIVDLVLGAILAAAANWCQATISPISPGKTGKR